jgi:hypothetical protein
MDLGIKKILTGLVKDPSKIVTIVDAWVTASNPTIEQKNLAEARWNVCIQCPEFRSEREITGEPYCNDCGCPLMKKIFTKEFNECPQKKWKEVDDLLWIHTQKKKKTLL